MKFHAKSFDLASQVGLLKRPEVIDRCHHLPDWIGELRSPDGRATMEKALDVLIPESLWELWNLPPPLCLLDSWGDYAYLSQAILTRPEVWTWDGKRYLEFAMHGHSGEFLIVESFGGTNPDPAVGYGFLEPGPPKWTHERLSDFIFTEVRAGIAQSWKSFAQHRVYSYHVRLISLTDSAAEEVIEVSAYAGQSVRDLVSDRYPKRQILGVRRQGRSM